MLILRAVILSKPSAATSRASPSRSFKRAAWAIVAGTTSITDRDLRHDGEDGRREWVLLLDDQPAAAVPFGRDGDLVVAAERLHRRAQRLARALLHLGGDDRPRARAARHLPLDRDRDAA